MSPVDIPYASHKDPRTPEQKYQDAKASFYTDAAIVAVNTMLGIAREMATKVANIISISSKIEKRAEYQILHNYLQEPDMLTAVNALRKELSRNAEYHNYIFRRMCVASSILSQCRDDFGDFSEEYLERLDVCDATFAPYVARIRTELINLLRPVKCSDPNMFYLVILSVMMAKRFKAMRGYIKTFAGGFRKDEELAPIMYFQADKCLMTIAHRCNFRDKQGRELILLFNLDEEKEFIEQSRKKSWQRRHPEGSYQVVNIFRSVFDSDKMFRLLWELETKTLEIETIDKIIMQAEGKDPRYRDDYPYKNVMSCVNTYEQAQLNNTITLCKWDKLPRRLRDFADSVARRKVIDPRRRPRPVACFRRKYILDNRGNRIPTADKKDYEFTLEFVGIWNSIGEASAEYGIPIHRICDCLNERAQHDNQKNVWISFETYVRSIYISLQSCHPAYAEELATLFPEYNLTTNQQ